MEALRTGEEGEEPPKSIRILGSELVETYTVRRGANEGGCGGGWVWRVRGVGVPGVP